MDKLTVCNNYLYLCGSMWINYLYLYMWTSYLSYDVCFVSKDMFWLCLYVEMEPEEIELTCQFRQTQRRRGFKNPHLLCSERIRGFTNPHLQWLTTYFDRFHVTLCWISASQPNVLCTEQNLLHKNKNIHLSYRPNIIQVILQNWRFANILQIILQFILQTGIMHHPFLPSWLLRR